MGSHREHDGESCRDKEIAFFALAERFPKASEPQEIQRLGEDIERCIFSSLESSSLE